MSQISRRQFIRGLGGFTLALPTLPSLLIPSSAKAAAAPPKRFVAIGNFDGYYEKVYYPTAASIAGESKFASDVYYKSLESMAGSMSELFDSQFNPLRAKMNIYRGLDMPGSVGHSAANMLCGAARVVFGDNNPIDPVGTSRSIDVILGKSKNFYPTPPEYTSLLGQEPSYTYGISFDKDAAGKTIRLPYDKYPEDMFTRVFGSRILDSSVAAQFKAKKVTIGDLVLNDYKALMNHKRMGADDKITLDNFITQLQALNNRINQSVIVTCSKPTLRRLSSRYWDSLTEEERFSFFSNYIDTMVAAMACDLTRISVITMRLFGHDHGLSHGDPNNRDNQLKYLQNTKKIARVVVELATKMDAFKEADGTSMLDNSILFWGNEDANGSPHSCMSMPAVSFGGAGGKLKTGYYVDYRQRVEGAANPFKPHINQPSGMGRSYTQLLITFMRALGLQPNDYLGYGDGGGFGSFDKNAPYSNGAYVAYEQYRNEPLPFVSLV